MAAIYDNDRRVDYISSAFALIAILVSCLGLLGVSLFDLRQRYREIAIRKAYGASNADIIGRLFAESLCTTLMGGVLGYALSCVLVVAGGTWLFGTGGVELEGIVLGSDLLLRPTLFLTVLAACLVFNGSG